MQKRVVEFSKRAQWPIAVAEFLNLFGRKLADLIQRPRTSKLGIAGPSRWQLHNSRYLYSRVSVARFHLERAQFDAVVGQAAALPIQQAGRLLSLRQSA
jgi:hypothetical protein